MNAFGAWLYRHQLALAIACLGSGALSWSTNDAGAFHWIGAVAVMVSIFNLGIWAGQK